MDLNSRSSTPEAPPQDLWSSILDSVSSSRSIPAKNVLILGEPSAGKSSLTSALLQKPPEEDTAEGQDFALGYDWADVRDDADEDTLARLSVYTVPSSAPSYTALLPHFLPPRSALPHTAVIIVLDWTRPWTFVEQLLKWLVWVEFWTQGDGSRDLEIVREENRERLQSYLQHYAEPSSEPLSAAATHSDTLLPLGQGTLTHNASGVPVIVVCTKADLIDENNDLVGVGASGMGGMVKGKGGEWEERTDSVMQILRTICLKYGAALFYTTPLPATLQVVRQYALHLLFVPPAPSSGMSSADGLAPARNPFSFQHKPNTLDRDRIVVPAGWDSWGKITVLREGFDPKAWGEAWERDLDAMNGEPSEEPGARKLFNALVPDQAPKPPPLPPFNNPTPEQAFLAKHYDENAKKPDRDPRGAFRNPAEPAMGIVGPLGSSSFALPNVERALSEMEGGALGGVSDKLNVSVAGKRTSSRPSASAMAASASSGRASAASPISPTTPGSAGGQTQHQVLHNFFQSLLTPKDRALAGGNISRSTSTKPNGTEESNGS
ncbi:DLIC-domain-containing protein [Punctularia strigosozonata HHB-11173 SS5]|uniref:DLIC-domain-containing protein n=1 Tax=Punctularia strigosozonata (strain HHB-11173) TaxID=741275 RepID=UPI00044172D5|nr:DLIC-domain-containing protein [Punctularia strigosozonata HHB-11173 SS5]EIN10994.1 DLIC-domain-containing protein [Punctularia strigosozonata HHB-11173 SS5]